MSTNLISHLELMRTAYRSGNPSDFVRALTDDFVRIDHRRLGFTEMSRQDLVDSFDVVDEAGRDSAQVVLRAAIDDVDDRWSLDLLGVSIGDSLWEVLILTEVDGD